MPPKSRKKRAASVPEDPDLASTTRRGSGAPPVKQFQPMIEKSPNATQAVAGPFSAATAAGSSTAGKTTKSKTPNNTTPRPKTVANNVIETPRRSARLRANVGPSLLVAAPAKPPTTNKAAPKSTPNIMVTDTTSQVSSAGSRKPPAAKSRRSKAVIPKPQSRTTNAKAAAHSTMPKGRQKKKPRPSPLPSPPPVSIHHRFFPDIIDKILTHKDSWVAFRGASREYYERINSMMYRHLVVTPVFRDSADSDGSADDSDHYFYDEEDLDPVLLDVSSPTGPLPDFPVRQYDSLYSYSHKDKKKLELSATLFKKYTHVLELPIQMNVADMIWFKKKGQRLHTARLYFDGTLPFREGADEGCNEVGEELHIIPSIADKVILLPSAPGEDATLEVTHTNIAFHFPIVKLVTHIDFSNDAVCYVPHQPYATDETVDSYVTNHLVYILRFASGKVEAAKWLTLQDNIAFLLYRAFIFAGSTPKVSIVDFDESATAQDQFLEDLKSRLEDYKNDLDDLEDSHYCPSCGEHHSDMGFKGFVTEAMSKVMFSTRDEYASTLAPGEFEDEECR